MSKPTYYGPSRRASPARIIFNTIFRAIIDILAYTNKTFLREYKDYTTFYLVVWVFVFLYHFCFSGRPEPPPICKSTPHVHNTYFSPHLSGFYIPSSLKHYPSLSPQDRAEVDRAKKLIVRLCESYWTRTELGSIWGRVWAWLCEGDGDAAGAWGTVVVGGLKGVEMWYWRRERTRIREREMVKKMV